MARMTTPSDDDSSTSNAGADTIMDDASPYARTEEPGAATHTEHGPMFDRSGHEYRAIPISMDALRNLLSIDNDKTRDTASVRDIFGPKLVANHIELEYAVYHVFEDNFGAIEVVHKLGGTALHIPMANGSVGIVTIESKSAEDYAKYKERGY